MVCVPRVFGGRLEYGRLKWWAVLFVMVILRAAAGDRREWPATRLWAAGLPESLDSSRREPGCRLRDNGRT